MSYSIPRRHVSLVKLSLVFVLIFGTITPALAGPAEDEYTLGLTLYGQKRWELATETFENYLKNYPDHSQVPLAKLYLAQSLVNLEKYKDARTVLRDFLIKHPENKNLAQAMYRVAECSYFLDDYNSAIPEFEKFLNKAPDDQLTEWALPYLADSYLQTGKHQQAEETFRQSLEKYPEGRFVEDSRFGLARSLELQNKVQPAIDAYQQLLTREEGERLQEAQFNLGMLYFQEQDYRQAAETFTTLAGKTSPGKLNSLSHLNAGYAHYSLQEWEDARKQFDRAKGHAPYRDIAQYWSAQTEKGAGNFDQAAQSLNELLRRKPSDSLREKIQFQLADCSFQQEKYQEARKLFGEYRSQFPQGNSVVEAWLSEMECLLLTDQLGKAWQLSEQKPEVALTPQQDREHTLMQSRLLAADASQVDPLPEALGSREERLERARSLLESLLTEETDNQDRLTQQIRYQAARLAAEQDDYSAAISLLEPITRALPSGQATQIPEAWLLLANCESELQNPQPALQALEQYEALSPQGESKAQAAIVKINVLTSSNQLDAAREALKELENSGPGPEKVAEATWRLAEVNYARQNWGEARDLYQKVVDLQLSEEWTLKALSALGWSQFEAGDYQKAVSSFDRLTQQFPNNRQAAADAGYMQGMALLKGGEQSKAAAQFLETAETFRSGEDVESGNDVNHLAYRAAREAARAFRNLGKIDESADAYRLAYEELRKQPASRKQELDKLLDEWALLHYENQQYAEADKIFEILVKEVPNSDRADDARLSLAESDYIAGNLDAAAKKFETLLENEKTDTYVRSRALYQRAMIASSQKKTEEFQEYASRFLETATNESASAQEMGEIQTRLIQSLMEQNELKQAEQRLADLRKQAEQLPEKNRPEWYSRLYVLQGELARRRKNYEEARQALETLRKEYPETDDREQLEVIVGRTYIAEAKFDQAEEAFQNVLKRADGKKTLAAAQSQFYLAETALIQKNYEEAIKQYVRMAILFPGHPDLQSAALYQAGQCDESLGNVENAIQSYETVIQRYPESEFADKAKKRVEALKKQ